MSHPQQEMTRERFATIEPAADGGWLLSLSITEDRKLVRNWEKTLEPMDFDDAKLELQRWIRGDVESDA